MKLQKSELLEVQWFIVETLLLIKRILSLDLLWLLLIQMHKIAFILTNSDYQILSTTLQ